MIRVRFAEPIDQPQLIEFIRDHWSASHIFAHRPEVFAWQHLEPGGRLNMVLAEEIDDDRRTVLGVLGFIPMGRFDPALGDRDITLAIWKVRETGVPPGLGLRLLKFLQAQLAPRMIAAIGISAIVRPIYGVLRYEVGALHQAALFHPDRAGALRVAAGAPPSAFRERPLDPGLELVALDASASDEMRRSIDAVGSVGVPAKTWDYVDARFLRHPWYQYDVRAVRCDGAIVAVVVWRVVPALGTCVLRIVDVIGDTDWLGRAGGVLQHAVVAADAEYIDVMQWGIDRQVLRDAGFVSTADVGGLVVPNYFSPFERRNVQIDIAVRTFGADGPVQLFRADSDQDRPNLPADLEHAT